MIRNHHVTPEEAENFTTSSGLIILTGGTTPGVIVAPIEDNLNTFFRYGNIIIINLRLRLTLRHGSSQGGLGVIVVRGLPFTPYRGDIQGAGGAVIHNMMTWSASDVNTDTFDLQVFNNFLAGIAILSRPNDFGVSFERPVGNLGNEIAMNLFMSGSYLCE